MSSHAGIFFPQPQPPMRYCPAVAQKPGRRKSQRVGRCQTKKCCWLRQTKFGAPLPQSDWLEAFRSHPRIGESISPKETSARSATWSEQEQRGVAHGDEAVRIALAEANRKYERRFSRIFIVCATGKAPEEILKIVQRRLDNDERTELLEAAEQQRQITHIRLRKWLQG